MTGALTHITGNIYLVHLHVRSVELLGLREYGAVGVDAHHHTLRAALLDLVAHTGDSATGARAHHHHVHVIVQRPQDLFSRAIVVRQRVARVVVLQLF